MSVLDEVRGMMENSQPNDEVEGTQPVTEDIENSEIQSQPVETPEEPIISDTAKETAEERYEKTQAGMLVAQEQLNNALSPLSDRGAVGAALDETKYSIVNKAKDRISDEKVVERHAKKLADNANESIKVELETQELEIKKVDAKNKVTKKEIENKLFVLKQEAMRLKKEQKHLNALQKEQQKKESDATYWANHGTTLEQYKMHEGSNRVFCNILLWLDGVKGFFNGLSKVSTALLSALKYVLIVGAILLVLVIIPVTREWLGNLLGFIK